jgi:hypothetical protein
MNALVFDLESDGLLDETQNIHCIVIHDTKTGKTTRYNDAEGHNPVQEGVDFLVNADPKEHIIVGHNVLGFDIPVLFKLYNAYPQASGYFSLYPVDLGRHQGKRFFLC